MTSDATGYPPEGLFSVRAERVPHRSGRPHNKFSHYAGYGIVMEAGDNNGNRSTTPCNGSISGVIANNHVALQGATGADGIDLEAGFNGNNPTPTVDDSGGYVDSPSQAIEQQSSAGATINVSETGNHIAVRP